MDEARSNCVTAPAEVISAEFPPGEDKCSQARGLDGRGHAVRTIEGWGIIAGTVNPVGFTSVVV